MGNLVLVMLIISSLWTLTVKADYHIGFSPRRFRNPSNTLFNGTCCKPSCDGCTVTLRFCFRESGHLQLDTDSSCSILQFNRNTPSSLPVFGTDVRPIRKRFVGSFQVYIRVSDHSDDIFNPDFDPPFEDPLIDNLFIEVVNLTAGRFEDRNSLISVPYDATGVYGRASIQLRINAHCAAGYNGSDCGTFCQDVNGELTCEEVNFDPPTTESTTLAETTMTTSEATTESAILPIAIGASIGAAVVIVLLIGVLISFVFFVVKVWLKDPFKYKSNEFFNSSEHDREQNDDLYATVNKKSTQADTSPPVPSSDIETKSIS